MIDLIGMLPKHKSDLESANAIVALGYPEVAPVLSELMVWMQDINWPVAQVFAPFLASIGTPLVPYVRDVLRTDDTIWKQCILYDIVQESKSIFHKVKSDIIRMASTESVDEDSESLRETAMVVLEHYGIRLPLVVT